MLGHDLRNPLGAILLTAKHLARLHAGDAVSEAAALLIRSGASMQALLDDLTDFNRTNLGLGLRVVRSDIDLAQAADTELEQLRAAHPDRRIEFAASGDNRGQWDGPRLQQVLRNLVANAIAYSSPKTPVRVTLRGERSDVLLEVSNSGHVDPSVLRQMFEPLRRGADDSVKLTVPDGLGLGLFIVREIAKAHGGDVEARCEGEQTIFSVRLPRHQATASP